MMKKVFKYELNPDFYGFFSNFKINGVQALSKCTGWQVLSSSTFHLGCGPVEPLGNATGCLLASPTGDRYESFKLAPGPTRAAQLVEQWGYFTKVIAWFSLESVAVKKLVFFIYTKFAKHTIDPWGHQGSISPTLLAPKQNNFCADHFRCIFVAKIWCSVQIL